MDQPTYSNYLSLLALVQNQPWARALQTTRTDAPGNVATPLQPWQLAIQASRANAPGNVAMPLQPWQIAIRDSRLNAPGNVPAQPAGNFFNYLSVAPQPTRQ
jgi:hypothetical protein